MTFRLPWVLWFLVAVPMLSALLVYGYRARKRSLTTFGLESTLGPLLIGKTPRVRAVRGVLAVLGVAFAVLAWAGPQYGSHTRVMKKRGIDVVLALDFSKSMLARDVRPSRIERAKAELTRFLGDLTGDRVGVIAFAGDTMEFPMTTDYAAVELFLRDLGPYDMPVGGTAIGRALTASARLLERASRPKEENEAEGAEPERSRVVILLTDGEDHEGDPVEAAKQLAATGARVFVVGIGSATGEPIPTFAPDGTWTGYLRDEKGSPVLSALTAANEKQLAEIASVGNGTYFRAQQGAVGVDEIRKLMKGMKQAESKARRVSIAEDRYLLALLPAFFLLLIEGVLPDGLTRKRKSQTAPALAALLAFLALGATSNRALAWEPFRSKSSDVERGNELLKKGDADAALEAYDTARKRLPNEPGVEVNRGLALAASGKLDEAREAFQAVARGKASKELRAAANYNLGLSFIKQAEAAAKADDLDKAQGFLRESIDALKGSLRDAPGNRDAAWNLELARRQLVEVDKKREEKKKQEEQDKQDQEKKDPQDDNQNQDGQQGDEPKQDDGQQKPDEPKDEDKDGPPKDGEQPEQPEPKAEEKPEDAAKQPEQDGKKPEQQKGQPSPEEQAAPEPGKDVAPSEAQPQKVLPQHMQKALDALSEGEQSLEKHRARQRATQRPRRIEKDW